MLDIKNTEIEKDEIKEILNNTVEKTGSVLKWINQSKEEAREYLLDIIKKDTVLTTQEKASLIYNSRKFTREYVNSKEIYEKAKCSFNTQDSQSNVDDDWLHFFFDKAGKISNSSMQNIWAKLLAGEFNKPNSVSKKLIHIISIMDVVEAHAFRTFCLYTFTVTDADVKVTFMPSEFYSNKWFDFKYKINTWLTSAGYADCENLMYETTLGITALNSLENIGLIQKSIDTPKIRMPLNYSFDEDKIAQIIPLNNSEFTVGGYSLSFEGRQLYRILNLSGNKAIITIMENYLKESDLNFKIVIQE